MNTFTPSTTRGNYNQYRHGVLIGNFVEDSFGIALQKQYRAESLDKANGHKKPFPISEFTDKYKWPHRGIEHYNLPEKEWSRTNSSGFDMNIDFNQKNCDYYMKLLQTSEFANEINNNGNINASKNFRNGNRGLFQRSASMKKLGTAGNLLFGHGLDQTHWKQNGYASTYHLTMNKKIKTDTFYNSKYRVETPFMRQPKTNYDNTDWGYRKFKIYEDFTKKFDRRTVLEK